MFSYSQFGYIHSRYQQCNLNISSCSLACTLVAKIVVARAARDHLISSSSAHIALYIIVFLGLWVIFELFLTVRAQEYSCLVLWISNNDTALILSRRCTHLNVLVDWPSHNHLVASSYARINNSTIGNYRLSLTIVVDNHLVSNSCR